MEVRIDVSNAMLKYKLDAECHHPLPSE